MRVFLYLAFFFIYIQLTVSVRKISRTLKALSDCSLKTAELGAALDWPSLACVTDLQQERREHGQGPVPKRNTG